MDNAFPWLAGIACYLAVLVATWKVRYLRVPIWGATFGYAAAHISMIGGIDNEYILFGVFIPAAMLGMWCVTKLALTPTLNTDSHGSADWGQQGESAQKGHAKSADNTGGEGVALARYRLIKKDQGNMDSRFWHTGHIVTCAPSGSGKGIGAVIPTLLTYTGSVLALDIKGENYAVTHQVRERMGQSVYLLDPFQVCKASSHACNPLDRLDPNQPNIVSEAAALADMLVVSDPTKSDHWDDSAKDFIRGLLVYCSTLPEGQRTLVKLREILTLPRGALEDILVIMQGQPEVAYGQIYRAANTFLAKEDKERSGVLSTALRHTSFLDDPRIADSLSRSDFNISQLKKMKMTVYIAMPPEKLNVYARFIRCILGQALSGMTDSTDTPEQKVVFVLDEFAQLGRVSCIEDGISLLRGYGATIWVFLQDLSQLKAVYPKWQTFLANSAKHFYGTADIDTARYISDSLGQSTIFVQSTSESRSDDPNRIFSTTTTGTGVNPQSRALLTPDEVMRLPSEQCLILIAGEKPYMLPRLNYLVDPEYQYLYGPNPYHADLTEKEVCV
ncbi:MAG: type IV secretory system conjugative DNA transfer family protein [Pseudomonadales bacterium]